MAEDIYMGLKFDPDAMITLLGVQLYDTPMAMLRENVQNAYDAILERIGQDKGFCEGCIKIEIVGDHISIIDNGIGMDKQNLQENYWTAGHSGKNTKEAREAGVVGHFGIGALANFGVCSRLEVNTLKFNTTQRIQCVAEKDKLNGKNISVHIQDDTNGCYGTTVTACLLPGISFSPEDAEAYLKRYVQYIPIPVFINGKKIDQRSFVIAEHRVNSETLVNCYHDNMIDFSYRINFQRYAPVKPQLLIDNIRLNGAPVKGALLLNNDSQEIFGLNNGFGISHVQLYSEFGFGGIINFPSLQPTAGREAVSRESTGMVQTILSHVERFWANTISSYDVADDYLSFLIYLNQHFIPNMAKKVRIQVEGVEKGIQLETINKNDFWYYKGNDAQIKKSLISSGHKILLPSKEHPRRNIQIKYLNFVGVEEKRDEIRVEHIYGGNEIMPEEFLLLDDIKRIIEDDYVIHDAEVCLAEITLGVKILVEPNKRDSFTIFIAKDHGEIKNLISVQSQYELYLSLVKDFVRVVLYNQFVSYIPKDQKERAAYIYDSIERKREDLILDYNDVSELRIALRELEAGEIENSEFIERARKIRTANQEQTVSSQQVASVETVVKSVSAQQTSISNTNQEQQEQFVYIPQPPILELGEYTDKKILTSDKEMATFHGHQMFLSVSPNFNREHRSFLLYPHSTKVLWSMHRIIYIFTDQLGKSSIYYEMELSQKLEEKNTGGETLVSTTIITKNSIFVPIPRKLYQYFDLKEGASLKFRVHFVKVYDKQ